MSNDAIKSGDLVYVYRDCCGRYRGLHFTVDSIHNLHGENAYYYCQFCAAGEHRRGIVYFKDGVPNVMMCAPREWLKKVPPIGDLDGVEDKRDLKIPAPKREDACV